MMTAGIEPFLVLAGAQLIRYFGLDVLECDQEIFLQRFPLREILFESLGAGRRHAAPPRFGVPAVQVRVLAPQFTSQTLSITHRGSGVALQLSETSAARRSTAALLAAGCLCAASTLLSRLLPRQLALLRTRLLCLLSLLPVRRCLPLLVAPAAWRRTRPRLILALALQLLHR